MARSDLLVSLVRAGAAGDRKEVATAVEAIIAEERVKQHNILADRLTRALRSNGSGGRVAHPAATESTARVRDYVVEATPASVSKTSLCRMSANGPAWSSWRSSIGRACCARRAWSRAIGYCWSVLPAMERPPWPKPLPKRSRSRSSSSATTRSSAASSGDRKPIATRIRLRANDPLRAVQRIGPRFDRLRTVLASDECGLSLRDDPSGIASERALVFEVAGSIPSGGPSGQASLRRGVPGEVSAHHQGDETPGIPRSLQRPARPPGPSVQRSEGDLQVRGGFRRMRIGAGRPSSPCWPAAQLTWPAARRARTCAGSA